MRVGLSLSGTQLAFEFNFVRIADGDGQIVLAVVGRDPIQRNLSVTIFQRDRLRCVGDGRTIEFPLYRDGDLGQCCRAGHICRDGDRFTRIDVCAFQIERDIQREIDRCNRQRSPRLLHR